MEPLVRLDDVHKSFGATRAVDGVSASVLAGRVTGLVGADGAGKTTLLRLMAGLLAPDGGSVTAVDALGYMPQRFGLYEDLSVAENLSLYADLRGLAPAEQGATFVRLLSFSGLGGFEGRLAGKLSGGMKQKLGLACALVATPRLLLLDEPSVGVDPVSRRELWRMVHQLAEDGVAVVWSTAYLDEAERCHSVLLLDGGRLVYDGPPRELTARVAGRSFAVRGAHDRRAVQAAARRLLGVADALIQGAAVRLVTAEGVAPPAPAQLGAPEAVVEAVAPRFEDAFIALLDRHGGPPPTLPALVHHPRPRGGAVVEAAGLTRRFGDFTAVDRIGFTVAPGEIFGLLGPNGAGKSTTFRMLCGLMPPSSGIARVAGIDLAQAAPEAKQRLGYMSQKFSLYPDLSVRQNLDFFAGVYGLTGARRRQVCGAMLDVFALAPMADVDAGQLPLGFKQRLALAAAVLHGPDILFLDEPTSGVDPLIRREFWGHINTLAADGVAVLVTTHFLDEAEYCDRIGIVYRGRLIALGSPDDIKAGLRGPDCPDPTLEDAFIALVEASDREARP
ncbi:MAG: ATP-binding cassette domain-containing protein [Bacteroidales bacterium]